MQRDGGRGASFESFDNSGIDMICDNKQQPPSTTADGLGQSNYIDSSSSPAGLTSNWEDHEIKDESNTQQRRSRYEFESKESVTEYSDNSLDEWSSYLETDKSKKHSKRRHQNDTKNSSRNSRRKTCSNP